MTSAQLLVLLTAERPQHDDWWIVYSTFPGTTFYASRYHITVDPLDVIFVILFGQPLINDNAYTVRTFCDRLAAATPATAAAPIFIPGPNGLQEVSGITVLPPLVGDTIGFVGLNGDWTPTRPLDPPPIPGDRRRQRPRPSWPHIPVADP